MAMGRPREFNAEQALDRALAVFWQKGYEGASLPDLTAAMGINRPSMYAAFGNKEELFRKALERYTQKSRDSMKEALSAPTARGAIEKLLFGIAESVGCPTSPKGCLLVQGALACGEEAEPIRRELAARRAASEAMLRERFERGIADGDVPAAARASDLASYFSTVIQGMAVQSNSGASRNDLHSIAEMALKALPSN
ncbi:MAG: TetR/AcrR family transcriptional regulator [Micavibrio sp.]|nr:TetR/AcrR family transcriptional regulator [Micavibrio sp.]